MMQSVIYVTDYIELYEIQYLLSHCQTNTQHTQAERLYRYYILVIG